MESRSAFAISLPSLIKAHLKQGVIWALERAVAADPYLAEAWNGLAVVRMRAGDESGAIEAWRRAIAADANLRDALYNLGVVLGRLGDRDGAVEALRRYAALVDGAEREEALAMLSALGAAPDR